jgi:hypothetical protein
MKRVLIATAVMLLAGCSGVGDEALDVSQQTGTRHTLYTHCGVVSTTFDGVLWLADPPLRDESGNPPAGWDENETPGLFVPLTQNKAVFKADSGVEATFKRATAGAADPGRNCD